MASENVDFVRSICAAWERGDFSSVEWADPEIEFAIADGPVPGRWKEVAGMAEGFRGFLSAWEEYRVEGVDEYRELDDQHVLALPRHSGRGKSSGLELEQMSAKGAALFFIPDAKVRELVLYWDRDRAFADLGLKE